MPVIFDEVVGTVVPDTTQSSTEDSPSPQTPSTPDLRSQLKRLERRATRLKAD